MHFVTTIRKIREQLHISSREYSVRNVVPGVNIGSAHLRKLERAQVALPCGATTGNIVNELSQGPDTMPALAGEVSTDLQETICKPLQPFTESVR